MKDLSITYAYDSDKKLVHVQDANKHTKYYCIECNEELSLKVSKIPPGQKYHRRPHFSHKKNCNCSPESILHNQFKKSVANLLISKLSEKSKFLISWKCDDCHEVHTIDLLEDIAAVKVEYSMGICKPDIALLTSDNEVKNVIEIVVSHPPEDETLTYYDNQGIILIQIDLQSFDDLSHIEDRLKEPTIVTLCKSPVCEICGGRMLPAYMRIIDIPCYKCHNMMKIAVITDSYPCFLIAPDEFTADELNLAKGQGVQIEERYSRTNGNSYLANICNTCKTFVGGFYLHTYLSLPYKKISLDCKCFNCIDKQRSRILEEERKKAIIQDEQAWKLMELETKLQQTPLPCPICGGLLQVRYGKHGPFFGCCNYPDCRFTKKIDITQL